MREYKLITLMSTTSFLLVSGLLTNNRQMYWMACILGFILAGTYALIRWQAHRIQADLECPAEVLEGQPFACSLKVRAETTWGVIITEADLQRPHTFTVERWQLGTHIGGQQEVRCEMIAHPRGRYGLGPAQLALSDWFGLFESVVAADATCEVLVLPRPVPLPRWEWSGGGRGRYLISSSLHGQRGEGTDWHGTRPYVPGDPLRHINWRATARHREWHVKEFETSQLAPILVVLEQAPRWHAEEGRDFDQAVRHLAWLASEAPRHGVSLRVVDRNGVVLPFNPSEGRAVRQFLRWLATLQPDAPQSVIDLLPALVRQYGEQYRLVVMVPNSERTSYESSVSSYRQQGYAIEVIGVSA